MRKYLVACVLILLFFLTIAPSILGWIATVRSDFIFHIGIGFHIGLAAAFGYFLLRACIEYDQYGWR